MSMGVTGVRRIGFLGLGAYVKKFCEKFCNMFFMGYSKGSCRTVFRKASFYVLSVHALRRWIKNWRCRPVWAWLIAARYFSHASYQEAIPYYKSGLSANADHVAARYASLDLAHCYYFTNQKLQCVNTLLPLVRKGVRLPLIYILLAKVLQQLGKAKMARSVIGKARRMFPENLDVAINFYWCHRDELQSKTLLKSALSDVRNASLQAIRSEKDKARCHAVLIAANVTAEFDFIADTKFSNVMTMGVETVDLLVVLAERLASMGRFALARELAIEAMRTDYLDPRPYVYLANDMLVRQPVVDYEHCIQLAESACKYSDWRNVDALTVLYNAHLSAGNNDLAQLMLSRLMRQSLAADIQISVVKNTISCLKLLQGVDTHNLSQLPVRSGQL